MTYSLGCSMPSRARAKLTCTYSMGGALAYRSYCSDYMAYTEPVATTYEFTYTADEFGPASTETIIETYDYNSYVPDFCTEGTTLPEDVALSTMTMSRSYVETYQVVITAGQEKLSATAGASVSSSGPVPTGAKPTSIGAGGSPNNATTAAISAAQQTTNAAAPMITQAPLLVGVGVAMVALVL